MNCNLCWLVGYLEGEGSFNRHGTPRIAVQATDLDVIQRAATLLGIEVRGPLHRGRAAQGGKKDRKPIYYFQLHGHGAVHWMRALFPYMGIRRQAQITLALRERTK